jgi:hypothetical protein
MGGTLTITPGGVPDGVRRRTPASTRLLHEWSIMQPWIEPPTYELRLGPTPIGAPDLVVTPKIEAMLRVFNRYADMVGISATQIDVVEAKMVAEPGALSQLQHYVELAYAMGLPSRYPGKVVQGVLLWAVDDALIHTRALAYGFRVEVFTPPWTADYLSSRFYHR